jgi:hypothetical protein
LVFGVVFLGVAAIWALVQSDLLSLPDASVLGPAVLVVAGLIGIAVTLRRGGRAGRSDRGAGSGYSGQVAGPVAKQVGQQGAERAGEQGGAGRKQ